MDANDCVNTMPHQFCLSDKSRHGDSPRVTTEQVKQKNDTKDGIIVCATYQVSAAGIRSVHAFPIGYCNGRRHNDLLFVFWSAFRAICSSQGKKKKTVAGNFTAVTQRERLVAFEGVSRDFTSTLPLPRASLPHLPLFPYPPRLRRRPRRRPPRPQHPRLLWQH